MWWVRPFGVLLPWFVVLAPICRGQEYLFARYLSKDGLANSRARFLYQDSKGRLYVSTFGGLSVYDGSRFTNYTTENGLSTSLVNAIVEVGDDSLLIVPNGRALHIMVHGVIHDIPTTDHYYPVTNQLIKCSDGYYYAISDDGLFRWEGGRFIRIRLETAKGKELGPYLISAIESDGNLLMITDPSLKSYPGSGSLIVFNLRTHRALAAGKPDFFMSLVRTPSGEIIVGTADGIRMIDMGWLAKDSVSLAPIPVRYRAAARFRTNWMIIDHGGNLWLTTEKQIVKAGSNGTLTAIDAAGDPPVGEISSVFEDREGNIWLTNTQNGIARLQSRQVQFFAHRQADFTVDDLTAQPGSDSVWCYDRERQCLQLLTKEGRQVFHSEGPLLPDGHLVFNQSGWLTAANTIYQLHFLPGNRFRASVAYQDTALIDGRTGLDRKGNIILSSSRLTVFANGMAGQQQLDILADQAAVDKQNRIWVAPRSGRLLLFTEENDGVRLSLRPAASMNLPDGVSPRSLAVDNEGRIWLGTRDHGLFCLFTDGMQIRSYRQLTTKNGLSENFVRYLYCDSDNTVWAGTPSGLDKIRYLNDSFTVTNVTPGHEMSVNKIVGSAGGIHWVLISGGYLKISPSEAPVVGYLPKVLFSQVLVGNEVVLNAPGHPLSLRYDQNALSFYVGIPSFTDESQVYFSYLLEGNNDARWSIPSHQSAINFINLPPGNYMLQVKARFLSGMYPDQTSYYPFRISPPWWQTVLFRAAMAVLLTVGIILAIRRYTLNRLKEQRIALERQQAIEKERTRIATDMHDDLGAGLSRIKFLSDTIGIKQQRQQPIDDEVSGISEYSREMIDKMGEIVWALNQKNDLLSDLLSYTRSYAAAYLMQAGIRSKIEGPEEFPSRFVSGEFRRNVYLAVKEALHNIVKHSQAEEVDIRIAVEKELVIVLRDDGVGFDRAAIRPYANGLQNMERRIGDLGGRLEIVSGGAGSGAGAAAVGAGGTLVRIAVPI